MDEHFYRPAVPRPRTQADDDEMIIHICRPLLTIAQKTSWKQKEERQKETGVIETVPEPKENYLLVDGYNVIHAWPELKELADENMDMARTRLLDALSSFRG